MSIEFTGEVIQNENYKVKKVAQQLQASEGTITQLRGQIDSLTKQYEGKICELNATIQILQDKINSTRLPKGRPRLAKPGKRKDVKCQKNP